MTDAIDALYFAVSFLTLHEAVSVLDKVCHNLRQDKWLAAPKKAVFGLHKGGCVFRYLRQGLCQCVKVMIIEVYGGSKLTSLPELIGDCAALTELYLGECIYITELPETAPN